jgi:hypothetical protein
MRGKIGKMSTGITLIMGVIILAGCVTPSGNYGDIAKPIMFGSVATIEWLLANDEAMLRQVVTHNEQVERLAK